MRIQYIITGKRHKDDMNSTNIHFMTLLQEYICKYDYVDIVDHAPDIAHVCGNWNIETIRQIKKIIQNEIPVIFTSCNGLNDFSGNIQRYQSLIMRDLIRNVSAIHVCGIIEKEKIQHVCPDSCIYVVSNPVISNTTDANNMTSLMLKTYNSIINNYDKRKKETIKSIIHAQYTKDDEIFEICSRFLYIKYLLHKGNIPIDTLKETSSMIITKQYDEDEMEKLIKKLGIYDFVSSLLHAMNIKTGLTEGFMPIESSNNKLSETIIDTITGN